MTPVEAMITACREYKCKVTQTLVKPSGTYCIQVFQKQPELEERQKLKEAIEEENYDEALEIAEFLLSEIEED